MKAIERRVAAVGFLAGLAWVLHSGFAGDAVGAQAAAVGAVPVSEARAMPWWKGNLHTHSLWSDGDDYPESIAAWYKERGYHFLAFSEHNTLMAGDRWIPLATNKGGATAFEKYRRRFGEEWVQTRTTRGFPEVRLKPLEEVRSLFEEAGRFLCIPSLELTDRWKAVPVHLNATNIREPIAPQGGESVVEVMERNVEAVLEQRRRTGQPMIPHVNHPNFGWAVTAEELMRVRGERFFEVYNGHPLVYSDGDADHPSCERMWDIVLSHRLADLGMEIMYGLAVDDSHSYHGEESPKASNPGRGWVMVRARHLTPESIVQALEVGEFYASTGVVLSEVRCETTRYRVQVQPEAGVRHTIEFVGTRRGFSRSGESVRNAAGEVLRITRRYGTDIGEVLARVEGDAGEYACRGDELYVRARVISTRLKANPCFVGEVERAWTQPIAGPGMSAR